MQLCRTKVRKSCISLAKNWISVSAGKIQSIQAHCLECVRRTTKFCDNRNITELCDGIKCGFGFPDAFD